MKSRAFILLGLAAALSGCGLLGLKEPVARYPTKVLSAPFRLSPGDRVERAHLLERLRRLRYAPSASTAEPGTYRVDEASITIHRRGFSHPLGDEPPGPVAAAFDTGRLLELRGPDGQAVSEARLEPELLFEISGPKRVRREPSSFERLPRHLLDAVVAVEDRRFYRHFGVDFRGLLRAAWRDVRAGRLAEGGSTITQQLARNLYLSPKRSFRRKAHEIVLALLLELRYSKDELLKLYLDEVYFGQDGPVSVCGIQAAARFFFNKKPEQLTLGESALIAGLLASPYRFNPFRDPNSALARRRVVLDAMRQEGFITVDDGLRARLEPLKITRSGHQPGRPADFFVSSVQEELENRYGGDVLVSQGLSIHTTLDPWLQERAQRAVSRARFEAALVALDPRDGAVRALIGGKDYAASSFNRAISARRQPGSAFKPFVYGAALGAGYIRRKAGADDDGATAPRAPPDTPVWTTSTLVPDRPETYPSEGKPWTPRNYDGLYRGTTTVRQAFALSLNAPAVHIAATLGTKRIIDYARRLGIRSDLRPGLGLALGDSEVTLLELTAAYAPFANGGLHVEPYTVGAVVSREGDVLEYRKPQGLEAISPEEAWLVTDLLRETARVGTARSLSRWGLERVAAGKTGTTDGGKDAWFVGFVPGLACGVWTGQDKPTRSSMTGASHALPIWADFISSAGTWPLDGPDPWPRPVRVLAVQVDPQSGATPRTGCPERKMEYFLPGTQPKEDCPLHYGGVTGWIRRIFKK